MCMRAKELYMCIKKTNCVIYTIFRNIMYIINRIFDEYFLQMIYQDINIIIIIYYSYIYVL